MKWTTISTALLIATAIGCGRLKGSPDAGSSGDGGGIDGGNSTTVCQQDSACEDGLFCTQNRSSARRSVRGRDGLRGHRPALYERRDVLRVCDAL